MLELIKKLQQELEIIIEDNNDPVFISAVYCALSLFINGDNYEDGFFDSFFVEPNEYYNGLTTKDRIIFDYAFSIMSRHINILEGSYKSTLEGVVTQSELDSRK